MLEILLNLAIFLAKTITISMAVLLVVAGILALSSKQKQQLKSGKVEIINLTKKIKEQLKSAKEIIYNKHDFKNLLKKEKQELKEINKKNKQKNKTDLNNNKPKLFVIEFNGDIKASAVASLQNCLNTILPILDKNKDEVLVKLESPGGMVHGYGLAASQLDRIKQMGIKLTISVDKVAASGGYMMACVADKIVCAPFAIIGSIGVVGQIPNFNKLLDKHNIEFEQHTAGEYKRTLTMFGKNDNKARAKFKEELELTHDLFKNYITDRRPALNIEEVATGEHWYGQVAYQKKLVDRIATSDDLLLEYFETHDLYEVKYQHKKSVTEKLANSTQSIINVLINNFKQH